MKFMDYLLVSTAVITADALQQARGIDTNFSKFPNKQWPNGNDKKCRAVT